MILVICFGWSIFVVFLNLFTLFDFSFCKSFTALINNSSFGRFWQIKVPTKFNNAAEEVL